MNGFSDHGVYDRIRLFKKGYMPYKILGIIAIDAGPDYDPFTITLKRRTHTTLVPDHFKPVADLMAKHFLEKPKKVIFNDPATIVYWVDGSKTVVKAESEPFDPEKGLAMAIAKKHLGNKGNYYDIFRKWLPKVESNPANSNVGKCVNCKHWKCPLIFEPCLSCNRTGGKLNYEER